MKENKSKHKEKVRAAAITYCRRKNRTEHPDGKFEFNGWHPSDHEKCSCCDAVRAPTRKWPYTLTQHSRTATHVAKLYGVSRAELLVVAATLTEVDLEV